MTKPVRQKRVAKRQAKFSDQDSSTKSKTVLRLTIPKLLDYVREEETNLQVVRNPGGNNWDNFYPWFVGIVGSIIATLVLMPFV